MRFRLLHPPRTPSPAPTFTPTSTLPTTQALHLVMLREAISPRSMLMLLHLQHHLFLLLLPLQQRQQKQKKKNLSLHNKPRLLKVIPLKVRPLKVSPLKISPL